MNTRRSKIHGLGERSDARVIMATAPLSEMFGYATRLRSLSQGRAVYSMEFSSYAPVPEKIAEEMLAGLGAFYPRQGAPVDARSSE